MSAINIYAVSVVKTLTADGTAGGLVTVDDTSGLYAGAFCNVVCDDATLSVVITRVLSPTTLTVRSRAVLSTGNTDISAYTLLKNAKIMQPAQILGGYTEECLGHIGYWSGQN